MKFEIAVVVSIKTVAQAARKIVAEKDEHIPVYQCYLSQAVEVGRWLESRGVKAVVSLGVTARMLREQTSLAVFGIQYTGLECLEAVGKALEISEHIVALGSPIIIYHMQKVSGYLGRPIPCFELRSDIPVREQVQKLVDMGYKALISGTPGGDIAQELGIGGVTLKVDEQMIRLSIDNALHTLGLYNETIEKGETINAILDSTSEGILCTDQQGGITYLNRSAVQLLGVPQEELLGNKLEQVLQSSRTADLFAGAGGLSPETQNIVMSSTPIHVHGEVSGSVIAINRVSRIQHLARQIRRELLAKGHFAKSTFDDIIGTSPALLAAKQAARKYARYDSTVLITGESGTGKEMFAQSIHNASARSGEAFIAVNCAALPEQLLESELFGYVKGAFTGAKGQGKTGYFEMAHKGTIFLDEVGEIPVPMQAKLLRVLQESEITRIGDDRVISVDVRVLCATNKNLPDMVGQGLFREDLYYRLCVLELLVPPLRERREDIPMLAQALLSQKNAALGTSVRGFAPGLLQRLEAMAWHGNIRQLSNLIERMIVLSDGVLLEEELLGPTARQMGRPQPPAAREEKSLHQTELERILQVLEMTGGNKKEAAAILGIGTTTLWRKLKSIQNWEE